MIRTHLRDAKRGTVNTVRLSEYVDKQLQRLSAKIDYPISALLRRALLFRNDARLQHARWVREMTEVHDRSRKQYRSFKTVAPHGLTTQQLECCVLLMIAELNPKKRATVPEGEKARWAPQRSTSKRKIKLAAR